MTVAETTIADLPPALAAEVLTALAAVESADEPVPRAAFRALAEAPLRAVLEGCLRHAGRVLLAVGSGYVSGYDDAVAARLADEGIGVLPPDDRAVLTAVVLFTVAIPRAAGRIAADGGWSAGEPISPTTLEDVRMYATTIRPAVRRLRDAGILRYANDPGRNVVRGIALGPQFTRLTSAASESLFEELVLLAEPDGLFADTIRRRRADAAEQRIETST